MRRITPDPFHLNQQVATKSLCRAAFHSRHQPLPERQHLKSARMDTCPTIPLPSQRYGVIPFPQPTLPERQHAKSARLETCPTIPFHCSEIDTVGNVPYHTIPFPPPTLPERQHTKSARLETCPYLTIPFPPHRTPSYRYNKRPAYRSINAALCKSLPSRFALWNTGGHTPSSMRIRTASQIAAFINAAPTTGKSPRSAGRYPS